MNIEVIEELIGVLESSKVEELTIRQGESGVLIRKGAKLAKPKRPRRHDAAELSTMVQAVHRPEDHVNAPMVGIFHFSDPEIAVGTRVVPGQVVGAIESMKLLNDVTAEIPGVVVEVLVEDGMPVEFGQKLFRIEPV
jgi:biotin carboxyl carrier protein